MQADSWRTALVAIACFAVCPHATGISLRARAGPVRQRWLELMRETLQDVGPTTCLVMPTGISDDRLIGGLDLAASLNLGKPVLQPGLLNEASGGVVIVSMAERLAGQPLAALTHALDRGTVAIERDGFSREVPARVAVVALDESSESDEGLMPALADRLALHIDLASVSVGMARVECIFSASEILQARQHVAAVQPTDEDIARLCALSVALGIHSIRGALGALAVARSHASLHERDVLTEADIEAATLLSLLPRATRIPTPEPESEPPPPERADNSDSADAENSENSTDTRTLADQQIDSLLTRLPDNLLEMASDRARTAAVSSSGRSGLRRISNNRGRPIGVRQARTLSGQRLSLIDTLRSAAPWQPIRRRDSAPMPSRRLQIRASDFRTLRFEEKASRTVIFAVDASGSQAVARLSEAKGAVELLLADCYVRRDSVCVVVFRGASAEVVLPPTGSLTMARARLANVPGGGGTPLASGLTCAVDVAVAQRRRGETPLLLLLTDGKANVNLAGIGGRQQARLDVEQVAARCASQQIDTIVIDTSMRSTAEARALAEQAHAHYLRLPAAGAASINQAVREQIGS